MGLQKGLQYPNRVDTVVQPKLPVFGIPFLDTVFGPFLGGTG
jgi:hypothetical protein